MSDKVQAYLEAGRRLEEAATPGPWFHWAHDEVRSKVHDGKGRGNIAITHPIGDDPAGYRAMANAVLVADARDRLPRYRQAIEEIIAMPHSDDPMLDNTANAGWNNAMILISRIVARALLGEESA